MAARAAGLAALARSIMCVGAAGRTAAELPLAELRDFGPGGVIIFARNVGSARDLRAAIAALRTAADPPPLIAIDQEGGRIARITDPDVVTALPSAMALAAGGDDAAIESAALVVGRDLARLGISVDFAPCADLALDPRNTVIGNRSFGEAPTAVAAACAAFARGLERGGVAAAVKHFPGHGSTAVDSHERLPRVSVAEAGLRERDLVPFARVMAAGAASIVMTAHVVLEAFDDRGPATLSAPVLTGLLRGELGFDGVIATDCLEMGAVAAHPGTAAAAVAALAAGADLLLISHDLELARTAARAIVEAVESGTLPLARLEAAAARVGRLRERYAVPAPFAGPVDPEIGLLTARRAVTVLRGNLRLRDGLPVTVISFEGEIADGAAGSRANAPSLSAALRARRWKSELMRVALAPDATDVDVLLGHLPSLGDRNFVVVTRRAHLYPAQAAAVERILALVPEVRVISAREPYDAARFPTARHLGCIYGDEAISLEGCADVLSGRALATGRLPVRIDRDAVVR